MPVRTNYLVSWRARPSCDGLYSSGGPVGIKVFGMTAAIAGHRFALHGLRSSALAAKSFARGASFDHVEAKSGAAEAGIWDVEPQCGVVGLFFLDVDAKSVDADHFLCDVQVKSVAVRVPCDDIEAGNSASRETNCHVHERDFAHEA